VAIEIRPIRDEELRSFVEVMTTAFIEVQDTATLAEKLRPLWDLSRAFGAFDGGRIAGTFRSWATEITVPGGARLPASAISGVGVLPTHRRRGILRQLVAAEHAAMRERGEDVGLLYSAEYPIYGRFGYGPGCISATWQLEKSEAAFVHDPAGRLEIVAPMDGRDIVRDIFDAARRRQPGEIRRRDNDWDFNLGLRDGVWGPTWRGFLAVHRDADGTPDGYARYRAEERWERSQPRANVTIDDLHAATDEAYHALWHFLGGMEWAGRITAEQRSPSEPLPWLLTNARAAQLTEVSDGLWVRLFDIARALEARTYESEARIVLEIVDDERSTPTRVLLDGGPSGATCRPTKRAPDLTLAVGALGAAYLGGTRLRRAVLAHGAEEHRTGALVAAERLLRTADDPWCSTHF
jgi:predicted acetyltransferase